MLLLITISWSVVTITHLLVSIYGFRVLKADRALEKRTEKKSINRTTLSCASVGGIFATVHPIFLATRWEFGIESSESLGYGFGLYVVARLFTLVGVFLIFYSMLRLTIMSIQAMALAKTGIAGTRKRWQILLQKYGALTLFIILCANSFIWGIVTSNIFIAIEESIFSAMSVICFFGGFLFCSLSWKFRTLAANQTSNSPEEQCISKRCRENHRFTMIFSIGFFLSAIGFTLLFLGLLEDYTEYTGLLEDNTEYTFVATYVVLAFGSYTIIRDKSLLTIRNDSTFNPEFAALLEPTTSPQPPTSALTDTGLAITNKDQHSIGVAPYAPRPSWLPTNGTGQANVEPHSWSISLENYVKFINTCMATTTWGILVETKGERNVNMYDINIHFIKPWTRGTGCSIACLMNDNQGPVELMVSHAWAGSVIETLACIKTMTIQYRVPNETRIFFDTVCLYQADDGTAGGLTIPEQLALKPFTTIIHKKPHHGMFIVHTTISEVYERLWCVHEAGEAVEAKIEIYGVFDPASWNDKGLTSILTNFSTESAECQGESDKEMLTHLINNRGGFDRLDRIVQDVRQQSIKDLETINLFEQLFSVHISSVNTFHEAEA